VLSSTSSSNDRLPPGPWGRTWLLALLLAGLALAGYEAYLRAEGFTPSVTDDAELWCAVRGSLRPYDPDQIVLLGASRIQLGIDTDAFAWAFGGRKPAMLAVEGNTCLPVLADLSRDESFRGIVLCDVSSTHFYRGMRFDQGAQEEYVRKYEFSEGESRGPFAPAESSLRLLVQEHLAFRNASVKSTEVLGRLLRGQPPEPNYITTLPDRSRHADYSRVDPAKLQRHREEQARSSETGAPPEQFAQDVAKLTVLVDRIRARGGVVVFVYLPTAPREEELFPRSQYWDVLVRGTGALGIHFTDYPTLAHFRCPDGSHLDHRDAVAYSAALADVLQELLRSRRRVGEE
jgi:hypothetical protein